MHDFVMPIGPQSPAVKEPILLKLALEGEEVRKVRMVTGYTHRGVEYLLEGKNPDQALYVASRICGICSISHERAYVRTVENILGYDAPERVKALRTVLFELERMQSHLLWAGMMMHEIGLETLFDYFWREREKVLDCFEKITGGRVHHNINKIRTLRYDMEKEDPDFILQRIKEVKKKAREYYDDCVKEEVVISRLKNVGIIPKNMAESWGLTGPIARASGIDVDTRKNDPYDWYNKVKFKTVVGKEGDSFERFKVRMKEVLESASIVEQVLSNLPEEKIPVASLSRVDGEGYGRVEAPRGELFYYLRFKNNLIERAKVRTPSFSYMKLAEELLQGVVVGDVPVILASLDPCFSCLERILVEKNGKVSELKENEFRRRYACSQ